MNTNRPLCLRLLLPAVPRPVAWSVGALSLVAIGLLVISPDGLLWPAVGVIGSAAGMLYGTVLMRWLRTQAHNAQKRARPTNRTTDDSECN